MQAWGVTVAEVTTSIRGLAVEVAIDQAEVGLDRPSVVNCDRIHTATKRSLTGPVGELGDKTMSEVCCTINHAHGC